MVLDYKLCGTCILSKILIQIAEFFNRFLLLIEEQNLVVAGIQLRDSAIQCAEGILLRLEALLGVPYDKDGNQQG